MLKKLLLLSLSAASAGFVPPPAPIPLARSEAPGRPQPTPPAAPDSLKIVFFGSSVPFGQGATGKYGYASRYATLLARRHAARLGAPWTTSNISVPGDNTVKVLARWNRDLLPQQGRYVVYALALGNEGIHRGEQPGGQPA